MRNHLSEYPWSSLDAHFYVVAFFILVNLMPNEQSKRYLLQNRLLTKKNNKT